MSLAEPTLVLLPGLDGSGVFFRPLLQHLPATWRPIVVAYSPVQELGYDELLPIVRESLPVGRPFLLVGESFSGPLAIRLAAERPPGLQGLVLCATFCRSPVWSEPRWLSHLVRPFLLRPFRRISILRGALGGGSGNTRLTGEALAEVTPAVLASRLREVLRVDVTEQLRACPVPVLYLQAEHDWVVPARNGRLVRTIQPAARLVRLPSSHMVLQRQPEKCVEAIAAFLGSLGSLEPPGRSGG